MARFQGHEHLRRVALAVASKARHVQHRRVGLNNCQHAVQALLHGLKRRTLVSPYVAIDAARVLLWKKAFGNGAVQTDIEQHRGQ